MAKSEKAGTYKIISQAAPGGPWAERNQVEAQNADQAVRKFIDGLSSNDKSGTFLAVPMRQWKPRTVRVETVQKVSFDDGGEQQTATNAGSVTKISETPKVA